MKRTTMALGLMMSLFVVSAAAQSPAPTPGPEHKKLEIWVGDWTYEGETFATPISPAAKGRGKASVRPALGGFFVEFHAQDTGPWGTSQWFELDGYDAAHKRYTWNMFASDGGVQSVHYTIEGTTVTYSGTQRAGSQEVSIRGTVVFAPDLMSYVEKREMSMDGKAWIPAFEIKSTKVKTSSK